MQLTALTSVSPIDGRYFSKTNSIAKYFSEFALIHYRVKVEVAYFLFLSEKRFFKLSEKTSRNVRAIVTDFSIHDAEEIKSLESITNHDVKAVEYFLKKKLKEAGLEKLSEWVHFGLTSQDINNTAFPMMWRDANLEVVLPAIQSIKAKLDAFAKYWKNIPMLARTHGQPASPTRLGKELLVFSERIQNQLKLFVQIPFTGKFGGATGNFNAHYAAFPKYDWKKFADEFMQQKLNLIRQQHTTQIEHYDMLSAHFDCVKRINVILIDLCRDIWTYISMDYFKQKIKKNEVGSSAMPHKVNPIDFENAEGNLGLANALFMHLSEKLPVSRLQRDLTDSTVLRNTGVPVAHTLIALQSIQKGLDKLVLNKSRIEHDLEANWAVVAEAIQTVLRRENYPNPYEALKQLTRGSTSITKESIHQFINTLDVTPEVMKELKSFTPSNYTGK